MKNIVLFCVLICGICQITLAQDWEEMVKVVAPTRKAADQFGFSVSMSGDYAIIGAYRHDFDETESDSLLDAGAAYVFQRNGCDWTFVQKLVASDRDTNDFFGYITDIEGDYVLIGAWAADEDEDGNNFQANAGAVYVFRNVGGVWSETQKLVASDRFTEDNFGLSLSLSGEYAVIGAYREDEDENGMNNVPGAGSAYVFQNSGGVWSQVQKIVAGVREGNDNFGIDVAIDNNEIVVGAWFEDEDENDMNTLNGAGSAYIFRNTGGVWSQVQKIVNSDRAVNDRFGQAVKISGDYLVCGAPNEDEDEDGLNTLTGAGSAYIYKRTNNVWSQVKKLVPMDRGALDGFGSWLVIDGEFVLVSNYREDEDCDLLNTRTDAGSAYMFQNVSDVWSQYQKICRVDREAGDFFSFRVALDGDDALISSHLDDEDVQGLDSLNNAGSAYFFSLGECVPADLDIISVQDGNWNDPDTWDCACVPDSTDRVQILATHTVSVTDHQACDSLILDDGGRLNIYDSLVVQGGAVFWDTVYLESVLLGAGEKLVENGGVLLTSGILAGAGELEIADGGELSFLAFVENQFYLTIRNHGTINWNAGYYTNSGCGALSMIINEADGVFNIGGNQGSWLSNTNVVNYGEINVSTVSRFNAGCAGNNGTFNNISPGVVNVLSGRLELHGEGTHSGMFNVSESAELGFAAKIILTTNGNVTGTGALTISDSTIINIPYTFAIDSINNSGTLTGSGNKTLPSGVHLWSAGLLSGNGELIIEDGAKLTLPSFPENNFCLDITNHGTIRWSSGYYTNSLCSGISNLINASDGEFIIDGDLGRYFSNMNLTNSGVINKYGDFHTTFGAEATFNNMSPGIVNIHAGDFILNGNGTHSGVFNNAGILGFNANHEMTTVNNITGTGDIVIHDTMLINLPYTFPAAEITLNGAFLGIGDKTLPLGCTLHMNNNWNVEGEMRIEDGAVLNYNGGFLSDSLRNHGTVNWSVNNLNSCGEICTFINESDGDFVITGGGNRWLSRTHLTNYGLISKAAGVNVFFNGGCGDDGTFNNTSPGVVNILDGEFHLLADGTHSGAFNNGGLLIFNADHVMTTDGNLMGSGDIQIHDTMTINIPYTFPAAEIGIYGAVLGMGDKTLPAGGIIHHFNVWNVDGELEIADGAVLNYNGGTLSNMLRNHGTVNWAGGSLNGCGEICTFINESDGEFVITGSGYLARTSLTNYGLITKSTANNIHFNGGCGNDGYFNNVSPGIVNNITGLLDLQGDGTHSGTFSNSGTLVFNADHVLTTADNITGTGDIVIYDTTTINIPYNFPAAEITLYGALIGTGDKTLPSGGILNMNNTWNVNGELEIEDGAVLNYNGGTLSNMLRNHGTVNWPGGSLNGCGEICTFINESDGEFVITGLGYLARTNLTNYGLITKNTANDIYFNGGCGNDGYFNNVSPGVLNNVMGNLQLQGNGTHSGTFNNSGLLIFNANHELTSADILTGSGDIVVYDTLEINIPYTLPAVDITLYGVMHGMGDKILPSGCVLNMNNTCDFHSELVIEDGAILNYAGAFVGDSIRNHGVFNWISNHINACRNVKATFINESDGQIVIPEWSERWLTRTNLTNYGLISKTGADLIRFNIGCGDDGFFNNVSPGVVNLTAGTLILDGDGTHSGMFNNSGVLAFNADHHLTTADNITGTGDIVIYDTTAINIPYNFPAAEISLFGTVLGMGDKTLPSGSILNINGATWNVDGELEVAHGAVVNYSGHVLSNMVRNHGVINWLAYHINGCTPELSTIINESDGELVIPEWGERWLIRTNLTNYGLISKTGADQIRFNIGCGDDGFFNNITPGVVDIDAGNLILDGDGTHSGQFNNEGLLLFNADHLLTTSGNVAGSGNWHIYDTTTINIPYTIDIDSTSVYGALGGSGDLTLPSGNVLNSYYLLTGTGDLNVLDGGTLHFLNNHTNYFSYEIHNHGLVTWNEGYYLNNWDPVTNFINEPDGELQIGGIGDGNNTRWWLKTNLENHGVINMNTPANVSMEGCCGGMAYLNNSSPGTINVLDGNLILMSNGEHSGTFNVSDRLRFEAEHLLTANGNITGSGKFTSGGITTMDVPYTFTIDSVEVYGTITSMEDLTLPSGSTLSFTNPGNSYLTAPFQNHGTVYWNIGIHLNPCSALSVFTNASDGEFIMGGTGDRYLGNTHLINFGLITKDTGATIHINEDGSCGGTAGMFDNTGPGLLNVLEGIFLVR